MTRENNDRAMMNSRLYGKMSPGMISQPPRNQVGGLTLVWSPKNSRAPCCSTMPMPHVISRLSSGRPYRKRRMPRSINRPTQPAVTIDKGRAKMK